MIKDEDIAQKISHLMLEFGKQIDDSVSLVKDGCSKEEFESYRKAAGKIMGDMLLEVMNPIYKEHPGLKPKELK